MTKKELINFIEATLEGDIDSAKDNDLLETVGHWDSLAAMSFIAFIDEKLGFTPDPAKVAKAKTLGDLLAIVDGKVEG